MQKYYDAKWGVVEIPWGTTDRLLAIQQHLRGEWYFSRMTLTDWKATPDLCIIDAREFIKNQSFEDGHHFTIKTWSSDIDDWLKENCRNYQIDDMFSHVVTIHDTAEAAHFRITWGDDIKLVNGP